MSHNLKKNGRFLIIVLLLVCRIINVWNLLPDYIVTSPTVACFEHRLAKLNFTL